MSGRYKVIYADPPWYYHDKRVKHPRLCGGAAAHYPVMRVEDIASMPVKEIRDDNSILFLWATFPNLQEALWVIDAWGFKYRTLGFSWIKLNKKNSKPFFGIGYYTKSNCEVCLIGVNGSPKIVSNSVSSVVISPRLKHSQKPAEVRERIVQLCGDVPRLELFAREKVPGWDAMGFDIDGKDIRLALAEKIAEIKQVDI